jgi:hypothetical protein
VTLQSTVNSQQLTAKKVTKVTFQLTVNSKTIDKKVTKVTAFSLFFDCYFFPLLQGIAIRSFFRRRRIL